MDVYQIILDKGSIGALRYANKIDGINPVLASKIEYAILELEETQKKSARNFSLIKTAQSAETYQQYLRDLPDFDSPTTTEQTEQKKEEPVDTENIKLDESGFPDSVFKAGADSVNKFLLLYAKSKVFVATKEKVLPKVIDQANKYGILTKIQPTIEKIWPGAKSILEKLLPSAAKAAGKAASEVTGELVDKVAKQTPLGKIGAFAKFVKALPYLSAALEAAGIIDMYLREGASPRVVCHTIRVIISTIAAVYATGATVATGGAAALPAAVGMILTVLLNFAASAGCDTLAPKNQGAPQSKVNEREKTISFNDLSGNDQKIVNSILNVTSGDKSQISTLVQQKLKAKDFDNPVDSVAYLQKAYKQANQ